MLRGFVTCVVVFASVAMAQTSPTVVAYPLEIKRKVSDDVERAVTREFQRLLASQRGILVPNLTAWEAAVTELKRSDCEEQDDCLRQLAVTAGTLYAVYAKLETNPEKTKVIASGRVVRKDGLLVVPWKNVEVLVKGSFEASAKAVTAQLVEALSLDALPPSIPAVTPPAPIEPPKETPPGVVTPAPTPEPKDEGAGLRVAGYVAGGAGIVVTAVGVGLLGSVASDANRIGLQADGVIAGPMTAEAVATAKSMPARSGAGVAMIGVGAAAIAASVVLFVLGSDEPVGGQVSVVPLRDGVMAGFTTSF